MGETRMLEGRASGEARMLEGRACGEAWMLEGREAGEARVGSGEEVSGGRLLSRRQAVGAAIAAVAAVIAGCFSERPSPTDSGGEGVLVEMKPSLVFDPADVTINRGETIVWRNVSGFVHTSTDDPDLAQNAAHAQLPAGAQPWDSGALANGQEYRRTFDVPGQYRYFCRPHEASNMLGTITVLP